VDDGDRFHHNVQAKWHGYGAGNTVEENSSIFSLIRVYKLPSATACGQ